MLNRNGNMPANQMSKREEISSRIIESIMGSGDVQLDSLLAHEGREQRQKRLATGVAEIADALLA